MRKLKAEDYTCRACFQRVKDCVCTFASTKDMQAEWVSVAIKPPFGEYVAGYWLAGSWIWFEAVYDSEDGWITETPNGYVEVGEKITHYQPITPPAEVET